MHLVMAREGRSTVGARLLGLARELRAHAPFTVFGAVTGIALMLLFRDLGRERAQMMFAVFHPLHVALSAMVTAALFRLRSQARGLLVVLVVGYVGSVGVATLSDCVIPFLGESVLGVALPIEAGGGAPASRLHLGFIEEWPLVTAAAVVGGLIALVLPQTRAPHALHVLVSTWASSSHVLMNMQTEWTPLVAVGLLVVLFVAVWLPCCISDIVFPILLVAPRGCPAHGTDGGMDARRLAS
jgi:hypothetical protein